MADYGFIAFTTPTEGQRPTSCLMTTLRAAPTLRHFDPEVVSFWVSVGAHGRIEFLTPDAPMPVSRRFSWGTIRLTDRLGEQNGFACFGGDLHAERVGPHASLVVFHSSAPILRLPGHSQRVDRLADEVISFFRRVVPRLWVPSPMEAQVASSPPEVLYGAFLLHTHRRLSKSLVLRDAFGEDVHVISEELATMSAHCPTAVDRGAALIDALGLAA